MKGIECRCKRMTVDIKIDAVRIYTWLVNCSSLLLLSLMHVTSLATMQSSYQRNLSFAVKKYSF